MPGLYMTNLCSVCCRFYFFCSDAVVWLSVYKPHSLFVCSNSHVFFVIELWWLAWELIIFLHIYEDACLQGSADSSVHRFSFSLSCTPHAIKKRKIWETNYSRYNTLIQFKMACHLNQRTAFKYTQNLWIAQLSLYRGLVLRFWSLPSSPNRCLSLIQATFGDVQFIRNYFNHISTEPAMMFIAFIEWNFHFFQSPYFSTLSDSPSVSSI